MFQPLRGAECFCKSSRAHYPSIFSVNGGHAQYARGTKGFAVCRSALNMSMNWKWSPARIGDLSCILWPSNHHVSFGKCWNTPVLRLSTADIIASIGGTLPIVARMRCDSAQETVIESSLGATCQGKTTGYKQPFIQLPRKRTADRYHCAQRNPQHVQRHRFFVNSRAPERPSRCWNLGKENTLAIKSRTLCFRRPVAEKL